MNASKWLRDRAHMTPEQLKVELDKLCERLFTGAIKAVCWDLNALWTNRKDGKE